MSKSAFLARLLPAASGLILLVGCATERDVAYEVEGLEVAEGEGPGATPVQRYDGTPTNLALDGAQLRGRVGNVGVDEAAWVDGYADDDYASVYTNVDEAENGAVMTIFDIEGGLFSDDLAPGARKTFVPEDIYAAPEGAGFVTVVGCSGPAAGAWEFDHTANSVSVDVAEGEHGARIYNYTARFDYGGSVSVVSGNFTATP